MDLMLLGAIPWWAQTLAVLFVIICLALIILVLLQKGRGSGLSAAFGGAGGQSAFGSKTGDVFTWITIGVVSLFLLLSLVLTKYYRPERSDDYVGETISVAPAATPLDIPAASTEDTPAATETSTESDAPAVPVPDADPETPAEPAAR